MLAASVMLLLLADFLSGFAFPKRARRSKDLPRFGVCVCVCVAEFGATNGEEEIQNCFFFLSIY